MFDAVSAWFSVAVPLIVTAPVGASLTLVDRRGRRTRDALGRAMAVGVSRHHIDGVADVGIAQRVGRAGRPGDIDRRRAATGS